METLGTETVGTKTVKQVAEENNFELKFKPLTEDGVQILLMVNLNPDFGKEIIKDPEYINMFLTQILLKRIEVFGLEDKIDQEALFMYLAFGVDNPGKVVLFLIALVEYYEKTGEVATKDDISLKLFPNGFYDDETCEFVANHCMKSRLTIGSEIYISR